MAGIAAVGAAAGGIAARTAARGRITRGSGPGTAAAAAATAASPSARRSSRSILSVKRTARGLAAAADEIERPKATAARSPRSEARDNEGMIISSIA